MPPAKRKAKAAYIAPSSTPSIAAVEILLSRCTRSTLEAILVEAVSTGRVTLERIQAALPENKQTAIIQRPQICQGRVREGTGYFDELDDELLHKILSNVKSTATMLTCALAVCKAWRDSLKSSALFSRVGLWTSRYGSGSATDGVHISSGNVLRLVDWLPDVTAVHTLALDTGDKHISLDPNVVKKALSRFTGLTSLSLNGKKISAAVLAAVAKQPYVANLASFELGGGCAAKATAALPLLSLASRLETLQIDNESATFVLRSLANAWREKRGGAAQPLLRSLKFVGWSSMSKSICPKLFCELSELFPELEELHTAFSLSSTCLSVTSAHAARPCLRLRRLCLDSLVCVYGSVHLSTTACGQVLRTIFAAAANVEVLTIRHGVMYVSGKDRKQGKRIAPFPGVDGALSELPASLISFTLSQISLLSTDLDLHPGLPKLKHLCFGQACGDGGLELALELAADAAKCPKLTRAGIFVDAQGLSTTTLLAAGLTDEEARTRQSGGYLPICLDPAVRMRRAEQAVAAQNARQPVCSGESEDESHMDEDKDEEAGSPQED